MSRSAFAVHVRLAPPSHAAAVEIQLSESEHAALTEAANGAALGTFCRELVQAGLGFQDEPGYFPLDSARQRAESTGMPLGALLRRLVVGAVSCDPLTPEVAKARRWLARKRPSRGRP